MKINLITPCSRPKNLPRLLESIKDTNREISWYIVFDALEIPEIDPILKEEHKNIKIILHALKNKYSTSGNSQRNWALDQITDGFIYFLDDDNILHPELLKTISTITETHGTNIGILGNQELNSSIIRKADRHLVAPSLVDGAQMCVHHSLIGKLRWEHEKYDADGRFIQAIYEKHYSKFIFVNEVISYHNFLSRKLNKI